MSHEDAEGCVPPAEAIDNFGSLHPRPVGINRYAVLSLSKDGFTAYECDLEAMTCECRDMAFNRDEGEICKHLAVALYQSPTVSDPDGDMVRSLANDLETIAGRFDDLEQKLTLLESELATVDGASSDPAGETVDEGFDGDPVEYMESYLRDAGLDPADFEIWIDDDFGSLQIDQDGYLDDDEFQTWVDLSDELDLQYDGDSDVNFLQSDRFGEVFG